jgi:murein DD-endopeptidase MepM/ murein hydrolase activator NlpD
VLRVIAISGLLVGFAPADMARGATWLRPVSGRIVGTFSLSPADPYAAGQRRGIVLSATPGEAVRSACPGRVAFAGPVGRAGPTVSVRCGALRATYQGLEDIGIEEGEAVGAGQAIGRAAETGALHLGARRGPAYVDPATLLAEAVPRLGPAPLPRRVPPSAVPRRPGRHRARRPPTTAPATPLLAWLGLALVAVSAPVGGLARQRRRRIARRAASATA